ncbi:MAG: hypothetical protein A2087_09465 [Spirochaetes bacterium GWD1_61_31]|nr:MAG: hypothetical protein A2Y37_13715 [Spirochaetes bacterium GWB1_60_80]OHD39265.1 MAG: hypothetical protein A2087_09465 [Spirochaetes bacterium GWD1_61_31]OHD42102.1 MAG: hypothetical protein A2Y35_07575 [Spirochaetes bacterium GWE1_60_18]
MKTLSIAFSRNCIENCAGGSLHINDHKTAATFFHFQYCEIGNFIITPAAWLTGIKYLNPFKIFKKLLNIRNNFIFRR